MYKQKYSLLVSAVQSQSTHTRVMCNHAYYILHVYVLVVTVRLIIAKYTSACRYQRGCPVLKGKCKKYKTVTNAHISLRISSQVGTVN
jgi:hypothetical protein